MEATITSASFDWPTITTNYVSQGVTYAIITQHTLSFTGFHNEVRYPGKYSIAIYIGEGKILAGHPNPPKVVEDIDPNSDTGKFAQQKAGQGYYGVGIIGCWVYATISQVDSNWSAQGRSKPIKWANKYDDSGNSLTYRKLRKAGKAGEGNQPGPGEPDIGNYEPRNHDQIRDGIMRGATNMATEIFSTYPGCPEVNIEVSGKNTFELPQPWIITRPKAP
jgi:hypothetical protein